MYYSQMPEGKVHCYLCPHHCRIPVGEQGICRVRGNREGKLYSLNYGQVTSYGLDPIEKKPLKNFHPGKMIFSVGSKGCNLECGFCQNWSIAHKDPDSVEVSPAELVDIAIKQGGESNLGLAYTYSEPGMWFEFVLESSQIAKEKGLKNVLVTNGYLEKEPFKELCGVIDAMNIDVKGFTENYYLETCKGKLDVVKKNVETAVKYCHVEITTLLVPGLNDSEEEIEALVDWLESLDASIPLHLTRYFPNYRFSLPATPHEVMERAYKQASAKLERVYLGNI